MITIKSTFNLTSQTFSEYFFCPKCNSKTFYRYVGGFYPQPGCLKCNVWFEKPVARRHNENLEIRNDQGWRR